MKLGRQAPPIVFLFNYNNTPFDYIRFLIIAELYRQENIGF